jgi:transcriptional regulator of acetoin/glycerol metabolism
LAQHIIFIEHLKVDIRVIAAMNANLTKLVSEQKFREDLFYRLAVFPIHGIRNENMIRDSRSAVAQCHRVIHGLSRSWPGDQG